MPMHISMHIYSDTLGSWVDACMQRLRSAWLPLQWPPASRDCHISIKEMIPILIAAVVWGQCLYRYRFTPTT